MAIGRVLFAILYIASNFADASGFSSSIQLHKKDAGVKIPRQHRYSFTDYEAKNLYWFANYTVGNVSNVELLIDTGSTDLLLNPGIYEPSKYAKPYKNHTFESAFEGVNKAGRGTETIQGNIVKDIVSAGGLTIPHQQIGDIKKFQFQGTRMKKEPGKFNGLIGFYNRIDSAFKPQAQSWFNHLCDSKTISECRFGVAFGTKGKGTQVIGKVDKKLFKGDLAIAPLHHGVYRAWTTKGDITLDNKIIMKNQTIIMDTGTTNIQAPLHSAREIFKKLGYSFVKTGGSPNPTNQGKDLYFLKGFFPCNNPPTLGFSFPALADIANPSSPAYRATPKNFNIFKSEWDVGKNSGNNCTAVLAGTNELHYGPYHAWLVGQPLYQGRYVDHHSGVSLGFAELV